MKKILMLALLLAACSAWGAQIETKFIADGAITSQKLGSGAVNSSALGADSVGGAKIRLENDTFLRARNNAGAADVNLFKLNTSDQMVFDLFPRTPSSAPTTDYEVSNRKFVIDQIGAIPTKTLNQEVLTLGAGDITAQYKDSNFNCDLSTVVLHVSGVMGSLTDDYTLSTVSSKTRITFVATTGWGTGSGQALIAGDKIRVFCQY